MADADTCIICGSIVPEGRQVCPSCEMKIMQVPERKCWLCGRNGSTDPLDRHHIFGGYNREKSEKYGLVVYLCHNRCHIFGPEAVHSNRDTMQMLRRYGQTKAMIENEWSSDDFIREFGRNYL